MDVVRGFETLLAAPTPTVLTVGNFDGVHRAHGEILHRLATLASQTGIPAVVLTFEPHPHTIVAPEHIPPRLTTLDQKLRLFEDAGVDLVVIARSEPTLFTLEAEQFVDQIVHRLFQPVHMVEGQSFGFGRGRKGTPYVLQALAARFGCQVHIVQPISVTADGESMVVSSSLIRQLLCEGRIEAAAHCLARPYSLVGLVEKGEGRGRTIGFPTVNLGAIDQLIPADGVYAGRVEVDSRELLAAISVGPHPTFGGTRRCVEAHLLDFTGVLYGKSVELWFERLLREQRRFAGPAELADQVRQDVAAVRSPSSSSEDG